MEVGDALTMEKAKNDNYKSKSEWGEIYNELTKEKIATDGNAGLCLLLKLVNNLTIVLEEFAQLQPEEKSMIVSDTFCNNTYIKIHLPCAKELNIEHYELFEILNDTMKSNNRQPSSFHPDQSS